jgi:hypothetical protein
MLLRTLYMTLNRRRLHPPITTTQWHIRPSIAHSNTSTSHHGPATLAWTQRCLSILCISIRSCCNLSCPPSGRPKLPCEEVWQRKMCPLLRNSDGMFDSASATFRVAASKWANGSPFRCVEEGKTLKIGSQHLVGRRGGPPNRN